MSAGFRLGACAKTKARRSRMQRETTVAKSRRGLVLKWSGRLDLNQRPPAPEAGALPGYATPRRTRHSLIPRRSRGRAQKDSNLQPSDP